jgi:hypothetical protein
MPKVSKRTTENRLVGRPVLIEFAVMRRNQQHRIGPRWRVQEVHDSLVEARRSLKYCLKHFDDKYALARIEYRMVKNDK